MIVTCNKCGHAWDCKSSAIFVSCPSCLQKVRIKDQRIDEKEDVLDKNKDVLDEKEVVSDGSKDENVAEEQ